MLVGQPPNDARRRADDRVFHHAAHGPGVVAGDLDESRDDPTNRRDPEVAPIASEKNDAARVREEGVDHESSRRRAENLPEHAVWSPRFTSTWYCRARSTSMCPAMSASAMRVYLSWNSSRSKMRHLAMQFVIALVQPKLQAQYAELPGQSKIEAIFQLLHNFRR